MAGVGGYQRPAKPAAVSGPGAHSQRTDGKPSEDNMTQAARYISGQPYGEGQDINALAHAAPLAAAPEVPTVTGFDAPTERPDEPITAGVPFGPGPGPEILPQFDPQFSAAPEGTDAAAAVLRATYAKYPSPMLGVIIKQLEEQGR